MSEEQKNLNQEDHVTPDVPVEHTEVIDAQMSEAAPVEAVPEAAVPTPEVTPEVMAEATPDAPTAQAAPAPEATTEAPASEAEPEVAPASEAEPEVAPASEAEPEVAPASEAAPAEAPKPKKEKKEKKEKKAKEKPQEAPEEGAAESEPSPKAEASPKVPREKSRKQKKQRRRVEDPPRYKKHEVLRALTGVIKFILILLLGMIIAYGSIAGALFFAVGGLTIDMLQEWGIVGDVDQYLTDTGDVDLTATTLLQLILDLNEVSENIGSYNMRTLIAHYGVVLPEETLAALPTDLFEIPLDQLMSENAATVITENLKLGYLLSFFPDGFLAEPVRNTLKDRPLSLLTGGKYGELLADVHLGYFLGVTFDEAGNVVYKDPDSHTPQEAMAKLDVGALLEALMNNGDLLGVMANDLGDQPVRPFISGLMSGALLEKMCEGRLLRDVLLPDAETGKYTFSFTALSEGVYLGDTLGYTLVDTDGDGVGDVWYSSYTDDDDDTNDVKASTMYATLADISLADIIGNRVSLDASFDGLFFGDLQSGYVRGDAIMSTDEVTGEPVVVGYEWFLDGARVGKMQEKLANVMVNTLLNGQLDINAVIGDLKIGDLQGYTYRAITEEGGDAIIGYEWVKQGEGGALVKVSPVMGAIADVSLSTVLDGQLDLATTLSGLSLGDVQNYEKGADNKWYQTVTPEGGEPYTAYVGAVKNVLADVKLTEVMEGTFSISAALDGLRLGDAMDYTRGEVTTPADPADPDSYDFYAFTKPAQDPAAEPQQVTGAALEIANIPLTHMIDGKVELEETIRKLTIAEAMDYVKVDTDSDGVADTWYSTYTDDNNDENDVKVTGILAVLADKRISELTSDTIDGIYLGDVLGYTLVDTNADGIGDEWWQNGARATGIMSVFADLKIGDLSNSDLVGTHVRRLTLAEAMGYVKIDTNGDGVADTWYSQYSDDGDATNDVKLTGILAVLAEKKLSDINSGTIDGLYLGEVLGYVRVDTDNNGDLDAWYQNGAAVKGMMATMADLTIGQLADSHEVSAKLDELHLYEVLDYELVGGKWVSHDGTKTASGVMAHLMDIQILKIEEEIDEMPLGYAFGFFYDEQTGEWFTDAAYTKKPTGVAAALADIHLTHAREDFDEMNIGTLLGYKHVDTDADDVADTWYSKYTDDGDATNDVKLDGLNLVFAELLVGDLGNSDKVSGAMQKAKLGDALGFKKYEDVWYKTKLDTNNNIVIDTASPVKGVIGALCDNEIGSIETSIQAVSIGTMLNFTEKADGWYDAANQKLNGVLGIIAASNLDNVADNVNSMTVEDLWPERTGVLAAIGDDVKLLELNVAVQNLTVEQLRVAGVLNIDDTKAAKLEEIIGKPLDKVLLPEFVNALVAFVP